MAGHELSTSEITGADRSGERFRIPVVWQKGGVFVGADGRVYVTSVYRDGQVSHATGFATPEQARTLANDLIEAANCAEALRDAREAISHEIG